MTSSWLCLLFLAPRGRSAAAQIVINCNITLTIASFQGCHKVYIVIIVFIIIVSIIEYHFIISRLFPSPLTDRLAAPGLEDQL